MSGISSFSLQEGGGGGGGLFYPTRMIIIINFTQTFTSLNGAPIPFTMCSTCLIPLKGFFIGTRSISLHVLVHVSRVFKGNPLRQNKIKLTRFMLSVKDFVLLYTDFSLRQNWVGSSVNVIKDCRWCCVPVWGQLV